jgi:hypothetical protein
MSMKSMTFRFFTAAAVALLGLVGITSSRADTLCPTTANQNGSGNYSFTTLPGPAGSPCASAVQITINTAQDYARLAWDSSSAGYPAGLTLGNIASASAQVGLDEAGDQPFYMLAFTDPTRGLGQTYATDQILMIEFQPSTVTGDTMAFNGTTGLFNLFDNTQGFYLEGGQQDAHTLDYWLANDSFLDNEALQQVRIGIGLAGGPGPSQSVIVDSLDVNVPEPTSLLLLLTLVGATGLGVRVRQLRNRRS